ncbi:unnamed protein product [Allacma fusca]|uniref:Uncharacterized protein n=1 Tax=Allacma fusca TaxID=39272 RepID=A0A8J2PFW4_9HEXA|nr:unnamed protein product [Allacma fusca]
MQGKTATVLIGIGINVSNDHPTLCLNSVVGEGNQLTPATLVAKCLSQMEVLLEQIENGGLTSILNMYTENWLHTGQGHGDDVVRVEADCYQNLIYLLKRFFTEVSGILISCVIL